MTMTDEQIERERARFEACEEVARDLDLTRQVDGDGYLYLYYPTSIAWLAWLARAQEVMPALPPGWVAVPVEPTDEMLRDGAANIGAFFERHGLYPNSRAVYRAMLAAAPPCPAVSLPDGFPWDAGTRKELAFLINARISSTIPWVQETGMPTHLESAAVSLARWLEQSPEQGWIHAP